MGRDAARRSAAGAELRAPLSSAPQLHIGDGPSSGHGKASPDPLKRGPCRTPPALPRVAEASVSTQAMQRCEGRRRSDPNRRVLPLLASERGVGRLRRLDRLNVSVSVLDFAVDACDRFVDVDVDEDSNDSAPGSASIKDT